MQPYITAADCFYSAAPSSANSGINHLCTGIGRQGCRVTDYGHYFNDGAGNPARRS
jgi:hypothetical protein